MGSYFNSKHFRVYHDFRQFWNHYRYMVFLIIGIAAGIGFINVCSKSDTYSQLNIFNSSYETAVFNTSVNHMKLWQNILKVRFRDLAILIIIGYTRYYEILFSIYIMFQGLLAGMITGMAFEKWGSSGTLVYFSSILPHYIIYIAAVIIIIKFFQRKNFNIKNTAAILCIIIMLVLVGTFLEAFINPIFHKWVLNQISNIV